MLFEDGRGNQIRFSVGQVYVALMTSQDLKSPPLSTWCSTAVCGDGRCFLALDQSIGVCPTRNTTT